MGGFSYMDSNWVDYYKTLQVHFRAEPEIITNTYRFLSKKYHPDKNKSMWALEMMKKLNTAYSVLSDEKKREEYDFEWIDHTNNIYKHIPLNMRRAHNKLEDYYHYIANGNFDAAYNNISRYDKKRIKKLKFIEWQTAVAKNYELRNYDIDFFKINRQPHINCTHLDDSYEFTVKICERDVLHDKISEYSSSKSVVSENGEYGVFLGYKSIKDYITFFEQRNEKDIDLKKLKEYWFEHESKYDTLTGLLNLNGFLEASKREESRFKRFDGKFSIAVFEIINKAADKSKLAMGDKIVEQTGKFIYEKIRDIDIACRWKNGKFIVLFAQTCISSANLAVKRICKDFNKAVIEENKIETKYVLYAGVKEYDSRSIVSTIKKCRINLTFAKFGKRQSVIGFYSKIRKLRFRMK